MKQPSGKTFEARQHGDEWYNWVETKDGYGIYKNTETGYWEYYVPSDETPKKEQKFRIGRKQDTKKRAIVSEVDPATLGIPKGLRPPRKEDGRLWKPTKPKTSPQTTPHPSPLPQGERESSLPQEERKHTERLGEADDSSLERGDGGVFERIHKQPPDSPFDKGDLSGFRTTESSTSTAVSGTMHLLVIGVDYDDTPATYSASEVQPLIFGNSNSVADYYNNVSYSAVTITPATESSGTSNDGFIGWLRLSGSHPNPGSSVGDENQQISKNAILAADSYIDFSSYDTDGDSVVEPTELSIMIMVSGYEGSYGGGLYSPFVWGHAGGFNYGDYPSVDGKTIKQYVQLGEKQGDHLGTIGVICHELGHLMFSLPDLYDEDGSSSGIGLFDLMAAGSWGAASGEYSGSSPTHLSAWCKEYLSWGTVNTISSSQTISLPKVDNNKSSIFRLNTTDSNQYFLMENREFSGYDIGFQKATGSSGHGGLVIYHVDTLKIDFSSNDVKVNADEDDKGVDVEEANEGSLGYSMLDSNEYSANENMFFFSGNNTSFTDTTTPNSKLKNDDSTHISITDISDYSDTMTSYITRPPTATTGNVTNVTSGAATLNGTVNPYGETVTAWFEYGTRSGDYTNIISKQSISGSGDTSISAAINGLSDSTAYHYRTAAQNSIVTIYGSEVVFITGSWTRTTVDNGNVNYRNSLGVDSSGHVHISYFDTTNYDLKYATNASGSWVTTTVDSDGSVGYYSSLGVDSSGYVHISYFDWSNYNLKYATNASGSWVTTTVDSDGNVGYSSSYYSSLGVDISGHVHISYCDRTTYDLKYATNASGSWVTTTVDSDGNVGGYSSLGVDSSGYVHISYFDWSNYNLKYATNASGSWVTTSIYNANYYVTNSLGVDNSGYVHISYYDWSIADLKYATNASGSWVTTTVDSYGKVGDYSSLGVDSSGYVHISYYDETNGNLKYVTNAPGSWVITVVDSDGDVGNFSSLAMDGSGYVHISYYDTTNYDLKYARSSIDTTKLTDTTAPKGTLNINITSKYTNNTAITLDLSATDIIGVTGYFISESSSTPAVTDSGWTTVSKTPSYSASVSYTLSSGDGTKTVYALYKDNEGNVSSAASDSIALDTTAPTVTITSPTSSDTYTGSSSTISLNGSASDSGSGISSVTWSNSKGGSGTASGTTSWAISNISLSSGENVITITATDGVGYTGTDTITVTYTTPTTPTPTATTTPTPSASPTPSSTPTPTSTCTDDYEPNDDFSTAYGPLTLQSSYEGKICRPYDLDYFKIEVLSPAIISLTLNIPPDKDYELYLWDSRQSLVAYSVMGFGIPETITYLANITGTYYIMVTSAPFSGFFDENQTYTLSGTWEGIITATPTAIPTPAGICEAESIEVSKNRVVLRKGRSRKVTVSVKGITGCPVEGIETEATGNDGGKLISVSPVIQATDEGGEAVFTITAKNSTGASRITFKAGNLEKTLKVKVRR